RRYGPDNIIADENCQHENRESEDERVDCAARSTLREDACRIGGGLRLHAFECGAHTGRCPFKLIERLFHHPIGFHHPSPPYFFFPDPLVFAVPAPSPPEASFRARRRAGAFLGATSNPSSVPLAAFFTSGSVADDLDANACANVGCTTSPS